jgi:hypothetical protein
MHEWFAKVMRTLLSNSSAHVLPQDSQGAWLAWAVMLPKHSMRCLAACGATHSAAGWLCCALCSPGVLWMLAGTLELHGVAGCNAPMLYL